MMVGLLGLQGAFLDHIHHLNSLGIQCHIVRDAEGLREIDRLIIPGGESTVMGKFLHEFEMIAPMRERILDGMPVWGICAGVVLLAETVDGSPGRLDVLAVSVERNAYGRQLASTIRDIDISIPDISDGVNAFPGIFIRSPRITASGPGVTIHARSMGDPVFVQQGRIMATTFHPELTQTAVFHRYFLSL
ncbi:MULTISPECIES: pyridoxal 5'-phosphate synthase glutaminase subunit PdxT [Desulfococcus]|uniref:glutaminase n=1 Tax=Desulfococcus multivorans DSM 2059 TaxID=1121405 RepID=S7TW08_DESML|nr:pyridoxal 5'-phosphate synthase glutaminase subunit PdxT [Desulfococcus multivorans]AOY59581.1 PdxT: glutamine amidotransferase [Desulfococcus multivorans]AQV01771.1 pyridoxal 5'-phosphate synthase glutaminase subunit PdxT [Desulfococcus multivorans]EPR41206.1 pyridoxal 5'-phosphate synthase, glutaminase subunit Pdx2 [Desulfococcus multivorans DSM 2059]SKA25408.1 5'-phosphate synthase pdxT subunit [Desulfococcus multivorans DSM 2059]